MTNEIDVLLAEDSTSDAELTIRALKKNNLANKLLHVSDGAEALDFLFAKGKYADRKGADNPKVILLDIKMPKITGIEVLRKIKADARTKTIPVVILTSSKEDPDIKECYSLGVNSYVVKPLSFDDFTKAVTDLGLYWLIINQPA